MLIHFYNQDLVKVGIMSEEATSFWTFNYDSTDQAQIRAAITNKSKELLREGMFAKKDNSDELLIVRRIELEKDSNGIEYITAFLDGADILLENRIVWDIYRSTRDSITHLTSILNDNAFNPKDHKRQLPNFKLIADQRQLSGEKREMQVSYKSLDSILNNICKREGWGYKTVLIEDLAGRNKIGLVIYEGKNKTMEQGEFNPVLFSRNRDNILEQRYIQDSRNYRNMARVGGQGEGSNRLIIDIGEKDSKWFERKETFIDARDIEGEETTDKLEDRGKAKLAELLAIKKFDSQVHTNSNLQYKKDFEVGDIVDIEDDEWEITIQTRISSITEVYEEDFDIRIEFGEPEKTLYEEINEIKNHINEVESSDKPTIIGGGEPGKPGRDGVGLEYSWNDTKLGIKRENEDNYIYRDLKGEKGDIGPRGYPGSDAAVTKDKIINELGYTPESQVNAKKQIERLDSIVKNLSIPEYLSNLTNDLGYVKVVNLIYNTTYYEKPGVWGRNTEINIIKGSPNYARVIKGLNSNNYGITTSYRSNLLKGKTYTLSFEYRTKDVTQFDYMYIMRKEEANTSIRPSFNEIITDGQWHRAEGSFVAPENDENVAIMFATRYGDSFDLRKMQLEIGNKASEWFPQYEDLYKLLVQYDESIGDLKELSTDSKNTLVSAINEIANKDEIILSYYAKKEDIPGNLGDLKNDKGYITEADRYVKVADTRNKDSTPEDYQELLGEKVHFEFKNVSVMNSPPVKAHMRYVYVMTFAGWRDSSGGYPIQLIFGEEGLAYRQGINSMTWGVWKRFLKEGESSGSILQSIKDEETDNEYELIVKSGKPYLRVIK